MLGSVSVQRAQGVDTYLETPREQVEQQKKKISIPSVEVTAAQSQGFSARVGDFLVNKASQSGNTGSAVSGPTGADGLPPSGPPVAGPPPGPPAGGAQGQGQNGPGGGTGGGAQAQSILALLSGGQALSEQGNDGDTEPGESAGTSLSVQSTGANTQYANKQSSNSVVGVQFDEIGAYRFAASSY